jgi:hypothetical protein
MGRSIGTLRDADVPTCGIHAPVAANLLRGTPTDMMPIIEGCLTVLDLLDQRISELGRLIAEASMPERQSDEDCDLEILRANLRALRHCKAEAYAPMPANNLLAMRGSRAITPNRGASVLLLVAWEPPLDLVEGNGRLPTRSHEGSTLTGWATYIAERAKPRMPNITAGKQTPKSSRCNKHRPLWRGWARAGSYAALRLTLFSAIVVSFLSAAFSSFSVCSSTLATSLRPSRLAQAISEP